MYPKASKISTNSMFDVGNFVGIIIIFTVYFILIIIDVKNFQVLFNGIIEFKLSKS